MERLYCYCHSGSSEKQKRKTRKVRKKMKKLLLAMLLLVVGQISLLADGLNLIYPVGGEKLPINGKHSIIWTNSADMLVDVYLDWYDTNSTLFVSNNVIYSAVLTAGTNNFVLHRPSVYPMEYQYKVRLSGNSNALTSSSGFVKFTSNATFSAQITNQNQWLPNQSRNISISWNGFQTNDSYSLILESPDLGQEGYGFLITNIVMGSEIGTQTLAVPYPFVTVPAYPPSSPSLTDGRHLFTLFNKRADIITTFGSIDMVTAGLRMYLGPVQSYVVRGESAESTAVFLDAILATNNVHVSALDIVFTSYSTNWISMRCVLKDGTQTLATNTLSFIPSTNEQYHTKVTFPLNLTITMGTIKELRLECEVLYESGIADFVWDTGGVTTNQNSAVSATYVGGATIVTRVISSTGSFVNILQVINPKFIGSGTQSNTMTFKVFCKPSTSYSVESSTNLVSWSTLFTTNSVGDTMQLSVPMTNGMRFFRMKEN